MSRRRPRSASAGARRGASAGRAGASIRANPRSKVLGNPFGHISVLSMKSVTLVRFSLKYLEMAAVKYSRKHPRAERQPFKRTRKFQVASLIGRTAQSPLQPRIVREFGQTKLPCRLGVGGLARLLILIAQEQISLRELLGRAILLFLPAGLFLQCLLGARSVR